MQHAVEQPGFVGVVDLLIYKLVVSEEFQQSGRELGSDVFVCRSFFADDLVFGDAVSLLPSP